MKGYGSRGFSDSLQVGSNAAVSTSKSHRDSLIFPFSNLSTFRSLPFIIVNIRTLSSHSMPKWEEDCECSSAASVQHRIEKRMVGSCRFVYVRFTRFFRLCRFLNIPLGDTMNFFVGFSEDFSIHSNVFTSSWEMKTPTMNMKIAINLLLSRVCV